MAENLVTKILKEHAESGSFEQGEEVGLRVDQVLLQDAPAPWLRCSSRRWASTGKSFARIHRRNLLSQGILPLLFKDEGDYDEFEQGQEWTLPDIRQHLENGDGEVTAEMDGTEVTLLAEFSERERQILIQGGVRRQLREQKPAEAPVTEGESEGGDERSSGDYPNPDLPRG